MNLLFLLSALLSALSGATGGARAMESAAQQMNVPVAPAVVAKSNTATAVQRVAEASATFQAPQAMFLPAVVVVSVAWPIWLDRPRE